ncbi:hypothetical protein HYG81_12255 [Natrinema zhouii]|uniref:Uncharacterized protein n=1 Tax=Natrinema zhouii TaxID=1710539 RepID=A0A7D6GJ82_9EURY|nr:hypothetical protein [Natrinema zhouii]QLK24880.1 hypothetical protein HYG81_12255 [Natrinema zhouii]
MDDDNRSPKYAQIPTTHLPSWRKPYKLFTYIVSAILFNYLTYREVASRSSPTEGAEGRSIMGRFQYWFYFRSKAYIAIVLVLIVLLQAYEAFFYHKTVKLQLYGLVFDMVGAIVVARGLFRGYGGYLTDANISPPEIRNTNMHGIKRPTDREINSLDSEIRASIDALLGGLLLVVGFSIQIFSIL